MRRPVVTVFYQFDPWSKSLGGIQTVIRSFIKYAPDTFEVRLVGTQVEKRVEPGIWQKMNLMGRNIQFMPLFTQPKENGKSLIPDSVRYTAALFRRSLASDFMHFHRLEPTLATRHWSGDKTLFIHNDIQQQIQTSTQKGSILWQYFPSAYFAIERQVVPQFTEIFSCNTASAAFYKERYPMYADRVQYLRNTVDDDVFFALSATERVQAQRAIARSLGLKEQTRFILFAGRLHAQKDPLLLIQAMAILADANAHLLIAGEGDLENPIRAEIARLNLSDRITMLGALAHSELAKLQRVASIFVLSSVYEGLPVVVLEALSSGTPIVTTHCGETPNLLTPQSGVVCKERTSEALAAAIKQVLACPQNFPVQACTDAAKPFHASAIVKDVCARMMQRWQARQVHERLSV
ncbi:MAG: glycosyltransferase family 4 protein [Nostoc sp.]|uniref:glycosyltransferase family 4 protein n=1 Tax=Nostoc sp. TaxID=1180 RepID=UPI002FFD3ED2